MKKILIFTYAALILTCGSAEAGHFLAESDDDIERVYNNVHSFWSQHQQECRVFSKVFTCEDDALTEEDRQVFRASLENIIRSPDELVDEIRNNPQMAVQDIDETVSKIEENKNNKKYKSLKKGLILIKRVIDYLQ